MVDFSHLNKLKVHENQIREFTIYHIEGEPVLKLAPATNDNKAFLNAVLKKSGKNIRSIQSKKINIETVEESIKNDKVIYAKHIIKGWRNVFDKNNQEVEFSHENVLDFLKALPDWIFEDIRAFARTPENFIDDVIDIEETAKNLESD